MRCMYIYKLTTHFDIVDKNRCVCINNEKLKKRQVTNLSSHIYIYIPDKS